MEFKKTPSMNPHTHEAALKAREEGRILEYSLLIPCSCNIDCKYCFTDEQKEAKNKNRKQISFADIKNFVLQGVPLGLKEVQIVGSGEPTLYPEIWELIDFINKEVGIMTLFTNCLNNTLELSQRLFDKRVNVVAKLNGMKDETNDYLTGVPGSYTIFRKAIDNLLKVGYTKKLPRMAIHTALCHQNYDEIPELWRFCRDRNIIPYVQILVPPGNMNDKYYRKLYVPPQKIGELYQEILKIDEQEYGITWIPTPPVMAQNCQKARYGVGINTYGDVCFCAYADITHGNLFEESLEEILKKESVHKVRYVRELSSSSCGKCDNPVCQGGCRAIASNTTGDLLGEDPMCWMRETLECS